ncbi:Fukutin [Amphibalanus amphitrite]|uniref:Fukutin n=1 Tax=Amphibalanus amphitrite TaxID=1232801 RepID=A0A6A4VBY8_AMPAM|nr:Fukutin [Amphibalanus amphitrite]
MALTRWPRGFHGLVPVTLLVVVVMVLITRWPYPDFELCWSLLDGLRIGIPCEPNHYLRIAYGPDWASPPQKKWDYRTGRFNVVRNGYWPEEMRNEVFQTFEV